MLLRSSPAKDHKKDSPLKSQKIIKDSVNERCCFNDAQVDNIRHRFPANAFFRPFDPTALSDYVSETWVAFPVTPFAIGYTYPFPEFTQSFFSLTGISYIQAMPMIWRVLYTLERIIEQEGIDLGMSELTQLYDVTTFGSHRYLFKRKPSAEHPLLKVTKNDKDWKRRFFFVRRDTIPDGKHLPREWSTNAISVSHIITSPETKDRLAAFWKLDPETRTFKIDTQDSQEVSSGSITMSSAGKSAKPVSQFNTADLDVVRSRKKRSTTSPSISIPKAPTKGKGVKKRKTSDAEDLQGLPLIRHQFLEYFNDKFAEIEDYVGNVEEQDKKIADLQQVAVLKDLALADLRKELQDEKTKTAKLLIDLDYEKHDLIENAKVSAAITMYQTKLKMAQEAQDPSFDKSSWDVEGWKARLADLEDDEEEATEVLAIEASGSGKDLMKDTAAGGEEEAAKA